MPTYSASPLLADASSTSPVAYWLALVLVVAGLGLIVFVLMGWRRGRRFEMGLEPEPAQRPVVARPASAAGSSVATTQEAERLLRLMGEAEEVCARLGRELDDKAERLERLLARAEGMFREVERERPRQATREIEPRYEEPAAEPERAAEVPAKRPEIVTRPVGVPAAAVAPVQVHIGPAAARAQPAKPAKPLFQGAPDGEPASGDPKALAQQVFRLADAGHAPADIARRLGEHTGKVELILALRNT